LKSIQNYLKIKDQFNFAKDKKIELSYT